MVVIHLFFFTDAVCFVNYTGSLGFGENFVRKLLGQCGTLDVQDCIASVNHLIDIGVSERGPGKQFVQGGSHGGFLAAHCKCRPHCRPGHIIIF